MGGGGGHDFSSSESSFRQGVDPTQAPYLSGMYDRAQNLYDSQDYSQMNQIANVAGNDMRGALQYGYEPLKNQMAGGFRSMDLENSLRDSMANPSQTGRMYESILGGPGNTYADPLVDSMREDAWQNLYRGGYRDNDSNFAAMGRPGSDRNAVEGALLKRDAMQDMSRNEMAIRHGTYDKDLGYKMGIAAQADLGRGQAQDRAMNLLNQQNMSQMGGINYMPQLQQLQMGQMAPWMMARGLPWQDMGMYSQMIGPPTVLSSGESSSDRNAMNAHGGVYG